MGSLRDGLMDFLYDQTCLMIGADPSTNPQYALPLNSRADAAGLKDNSEDYVFSNIKTTDYGINRQMDISVDGPLDADGNATKTVSYVRTLRFYWELYGPDSFEWADKIRLALMTDDTIKTNFDAQGLSLVTDIAEPVFLPDPINLQWYERWDLQADFNQLVIAQSQVPVINSTEIVIETEKGVVGTCSI